MKQLRFRMMGIFLAVFLLFAVAFGLFLDRILEDYTRESQLKTLTERTHILAESLYFSDSSDSFKETERYLENLENYIAERITWVNTRGEVLYDSQKDPEELENHAVREEITEVLKGHSAGIAVRVSESIQQELYYVAVPVLFSDGQLASIIRLSRPLSEMGISRRIVHSLYYFILAAMLVSFVLTYLLTRKIARPVEDIMEVAHELSQQNYVVRYTGKGYGDFQELGRTMNELAENLENQTQELLQNDERLRELINHLVIGVMLLNEQKNITMVNEAMENILHLPKKAMLGKSYLEVLNSYGLSHLIEQVYRSKKAENDEIYFYHPKEQVVDANVVPIAARKPGNTDLIVLLYDITEIRRLEKVRSDFVANVSHELRTPITALRGFTETLLDGAMADQEVLEQFLDIILKESTRLELLVNDILELSRLEQHQVPLKIEKVKVAAMVQDTFELVGKAAAEKEMTLELQEQSEVFVWADPYRIKQILSNLINNALVYTAAGGTIRVVIGRQDGEAVMEVTDNGIGIAEDQLDRVFERFYRIDKARSRNSGGTGLGLSIVKYLVENMNGTIQVKSKLGIGTSFTVRIPLAE